MPCLSYEPQDTLVRQDNFPGGYSVRVTRQSGRDGSHTVDTSTVYYSYFNTDAPTLIKSFVTVQQHGETVSGHQNIKIVPSPDEEGRYLMQAYNVDTGETQEFRLKQRPVPTPERFVREDTFPGGYSVKLSRQSLPGNDVSGDQETFSVYYNGTTFVKSFVGQDFVHRHGEFQSGYQKVEIVALPEGRHVIRAYNADTKEWEEFRLKQRPAVPSVLLPNLSTEE